MLSFSSFSLASALLSKDLQAGIASFALVTEVGISIGAIWTVLSVLVCRVPAPASSLRLQEGDVPAA